MKPKFTALFTTATEFTTGGGAATEAPAETPAAAIETPAAAEVPAAETEKPGFLQTVLATVKDKASLVSERDAYLARATAAENKIIDLTSRLAASEDSLTALQVERLAIEQALKDAKVETLTVEKKAAQIVAANGFEPEALPAAAAGEIETRESLEASLAKETDKTKRWEIAEKLNALN